MNPLPAGWIGGVFLTRRPDCAKHAATSWSMVLVGWDAESSAIAWERLPAQLVAEPGREAPAPEL